MKIVTLILNWEELDVSKESVRRLLKEPDLEAVFVVDNGSIDGSKEYYENLENTARFHFVGLPTNQGPSVARNIGIDEIRKVMREVDAIFLLDGDILYVPGTIKEYSKILSHYPDAFCVGQNSFELVMKYGYNGTTNPIEADIHMSDDYTISDWFPMAWTQYGLFLAHLLYDYPFIETPPFNEAGYGLEDDDFYHAMKERGYVSLAVDRPLYYHEAHTGIKELMKSGLSLKLKERKKVFEQKWGKRSQWSEWLQDNQPEKTTRLHP